MVKQARLGATWVTHFATISKYFPSKYGRSGCVTNKYIITLCIQQKKKKNAFSAFFYAIEFY